MSKLDGPARKCAYCGKTFQAWAPIRRGAFRGAYCSQKCANESNPSARSSGGSSSQSNSAAAEMGARAASKLIESAGEANVEKAKADAERAKVDTMKAERDLALQALEIPEDGDELKRVFFSLASQVDFANESWYSKRVIAKMGGFVTAWKASHSGRPDFAVVLGLLDEELQKAQAKAVAHDKSETRWLAVPLGLVALVSGFFWYINWSSAQTAVINEELVGEYDRTNGEGDRVTLKLNTNSMTLLADDRPLTSIATKECHNGEKSDGMFKGCFDDGVERGFFSGTPDDCEGTFELRGSTLTVALTNSCQPFSGEWTRR